MRDAMDDHTPEQLIVEQVTLLTQLKSVLEREHRALSEQNADEVTALAAEKRDLARRIDILEHKRTSAAGPRKTADASTHWQNLLGLARECEQLNQVNGLIVHSNQLRVRQALGLLRANVTTADTYSADGSAGISARSRSLAQV